jgi:hypothetical protein
LAESGFVGCFKAAVTRKMLAFIWP